MYAIIKTGGKQYKVAPGDVIQIEKIEAKQGETLEFLPLGFSGQDGEKFRAGKEPGVRVTGTVLGATRAPKVLVFKFKRKKQYKRLTGHRQNMTRVKINDFIA